MEQLSGNVGKVINLLTVLLLITGFVFAIAQASTSGSFGDAETIKFTQWSDGSKDSSAIEHVGALLFTEYVIPFEVLSLILLAALIGGLYMARKEEVE